MQGKLIYEFGPFRLEPAEHRLLRQEQPVSLSPQLFSLLVVFVENSGKLISKEALRNRVWGKAFISEDALKVIIGNLRKALGDGQNGDRYIENVFGKGYRFVCPVKIADEYTTAKIPPGPLATDNQETNIKVARLETSPEIPSVFPEPGIEQRISSGRSRLPQRTLTLNNRRILFSALAVILAMALFSFAFWFRGKASTREPAQANAVPALSFTLYDFENGEQGWIARPSTMISRVFSTDAHAYEGKRSLAIVFDNPYARKSQVYVENPPIKAGRTITARILCPAETQLEAIAWFVEDREFTWSNDWQAVSRLIPGGWNKFSVRIPADAPIPLARLGIEFTASAAWKGTCYLDAVEWQ